MILSLISYRARDEMDMDIDDDIVPYIHAKQETSEEDNVYSDKYLSGKFKVVLNLLRKIIGAREKVVIFVRYPGSQPRFLDWLTMTTSFTVLLRDPTGTSR